MTPNDIYTTIQSRKGGSSGRGTSYWNKAAICGRRVNLEEAYAARMAEIRAEEAAENEGDDAFSIGIHYHALMELHLSGQTEGVVWDQTDETMNGDFLEAVRLYRGYMQHWGSPLERWSAKLISVETVIGGGERTGRLDALFDIQDTAKAYENTGLLLPGPGVYIVDWKTGRAKSDRDQWDFGFGNQSINYLGLARRARPDLDIKGMVFDKIVRHKVLRKAPEYTKTGNLKADTSFYAYLAQFQPGDEKIIDNLIQIGKRNVDSNEANSGACFLGAKPCPMFRLGLCDRK